MTNRGTKRHVVIMWRKFTISPHGAKPRYSVYVIYSVQYSASRPATIVQMMVCRLQAATEPSAELIEPFQNPTWTDTPACRTTSDCPVSKEV